MPTLARRSSRTATHHSTRFARAVAAGRRLAASLLAAAALAAGAVPAASGAETMSVEQARRAAQAEEMVLVDIRTPEEWRETGIADVAVALDMQGRDFVPALLALRERNPGRAIGLICATGGRSAYVATWLRRNGVPDIVDVPAGMLGTDGWLARKLPLRSGSECAQATC